MSNLIFSELKLSELHVLFSHFIFEKHDNVMPHAIFIILIILKGVKKNFQYLFRARTFARHFLFSVPQFAAVGTLSEIIRKTLTIH